MNKKSLELTFGIIKPHVISNPIAFKNIHAFILNANFFIVRSKLLRINLEMVEEFYSEHQNKFFYNRLITFMTSGKSQPIILARENAIKKWREVMGPTKIFKSIYSDPDSIRAQFGLSDTRNATHGADSSESVQREISIFFPDFNFKEFYDNDEIHFRNGDVYLDEKNFIHKIK